MRGKRLIGTILGLMICTTFIGLARDYAAYHDCSNGRITAVTISNVSSQETELVLRVYDDEGQLLSETHERLSGFESIVRFVNDLQGEGAWGLVRVETELHLSLGVWLGAGETWRAVQNVSAPVPDISTNPFSAYWFTVNYANTPSRRTGIDLINPNSFRVEGTLWLYDAAGDPRATSDFVLEPYESAFFSPEISIEPNETMWGVADVVASAPILLAAEYIDSNGELISVDLVSRSYYVQ